METEQVFIMLIKLVLVLEYSLYQTKVHSRYDLAASSTFAHLTMKRVHVEFLSKNAEQSKTLRLDV